MIYMRELGLEVVLAVHDEIVVLCKVEESERTKILVEDCMARAAAVLCKSVAIPAEAKITNKWNK